MPRIITEHDVVSQLLKIFDQTDKEDFLTKLPEMVLFLEKTYKRIRGPEKKRLIMAAIESLFSGLTTEEREVLTNTVSVSIDGLVFIANNAGKLFDKARKRCC